MALIERIHGSYVHTRRVRTLADRLAALLPRGATVLDVGCGDGLLDRLILDARPDLTIRGLEFLVRPDAAIEVTAFDGLTIPYEDGAFDVVMFVDVLHHTDDPRVLLREAARVSRRLVVLKDHTRDGVLAGATLRFMDRVGNARHGVPLPYNYWTRRRWTEAFSSLGLRVERWEKKLGLYPKPADWVFGRELHFVAELSIDHPASETRAPDPWQQAYLRFETPEHEIGKFTQRLRALGAQSWPRDARIIELFCGRGNGLVALERMGFTHLLGADLSPALLSHYRGPAAVHACDCRAIPLADASVDVAIVQGGLHHLDTLPDDLARALAEARRILRPGGRFVAVEPWLTPFLRFVHAMSFSPARRVWGKLDALATMIEHERRTYEQWLARGPLVLDLLARHFDVEQQRTGWGKLTFVGRTGGKP